MDVLVLGNERDDRLLDHLRRRVAEHPGRGRVDEGELAVGVGQDEALGHRLGRAVAEATQLFELLLRAQPLRDILEDADDPGDLPVRQLIGGLDEDDVVLAVPGLEGGLVNLVSGLGQQRLVVLLVLIDDLLRGDVADRLADELALGLAEELLEGRIGASIAALRVLEEGRVGHDVDQDLHEVGHGLVRLVPFGPVEAVVGV